MTPTPRVNTQPILGSFRARRSRRRSERCEQIVRGIARGGNSHSCMTCDARPSCSNGNAGYRMGLVAARVAPASFRCERWPGERRRDVAARVDAGSADTTPMLRAPTRWRRPTAPGRPRAGRRCPRGPTSRSLPANATPRASSPTSPAPPTPARARGTLVSARLAGPSAGRHRASASFCRRRCRRSDAAAAAGPPRLLHGATRPRVDCSA